MAKLVFDFRIETYPEKTSSMQATNGAVRMIPFDGVVESELFTGKTVPGSIDVQITNAAGIRHMCARYMFEGVDNTGTPCKLFVDNNGYFEPGSKPKPFKTCPILMTDSAALAPYIEGAHFRAEGHRREDGLHILVFDTHFDKED